MSHTLRRRQCVTVRALPPPPPLLLLLPCFYITPPVDPQVWRKSSLITCMFHSSLTGLGHSVTGLNHRYVVVFLSLVSVSGCFITYLCTHTHTHTHTRARTRTHTRTQTGLADAPEENVHVSLLRLIARAVEPAPKHSRASLRDPGEQLCMFLSCRPGRVLCATLVQAPCTQRVYTEIHREMMSLL